MKVFIIENGVSKDIFVVRNKVKFCEKNNLTPRLLDYTIKGASATRYQEYHKNYRILDKLEFIEAKDGDRVLWDSGVTGYCVREDGKHFKDKPVDRSVELENELEATRVELKKVLKQKQKLQDSLNLNRGIFRTQFRYDNLCELILEKCKDYFNEGVPKCICEPSVESTDAKAVLAISDFHLGEKVEESNNYFDSDIAKIRVDAIFNQFEEEVEIRGIDEVYILMLGDFIFSQDINRPDMKLSSEFPEVQSTVRCFNILASVIDRLVVKYKVNIAGVVGNESRFNSHYYMSTLQKEAQNSLDTLIFEMLRNRYEGNVNVNFIGGCDKLEDVIDIGDKRFLMTHGHQKYMNHKDLEKTFINIKARLEPLYGELDFMILGHIHSTYITDRIARNSSLVGSNSYSNELGFPKSFVSQNMFIVNNGCIKTIPLRVM